MIHLEASEVYDAISYDALIPALKEAFCAKMDVPKRHHHDFPNPGHSDSTLLLMPAWRAGESLGVKVVTVSPENGKKQLPSIHGVYLYFEAETGQPLMSMEAKTLTKIRTAATSALASSFLSNENSKTLFMIGTGALAPELIKAHCLVRPSIEKVLVWGRSHDRAIEICEKLPGSLQAVPVKSIEKSMADADIISVATLSTKPLVFGRWLKNGQHVDLVGSYRPDMREADDETIRATSVFVDTYEGATTESGDLAIPLASNVISLDNIKGDLRSICLGVSKRSKSSEITLFKSVGHAIEDLVAARIIYDNYGQK